LTETFGDGATEIRFLDFKPAHFTEKT
jgi:hypothetical protein